MQDLPKAVAISVLQNGPEPDQVLPKQRGLTGHPQFQEDQVREHA